MLWRIVFYGKRLGAIGVSQGFSETVEAESADAAVLALYDRYEHIHVVLVSPILTRETR